MKNKKIICNECETECQVKYDLKSGPEHCPFCGSDDIHVLKPEEEVLNTFDKLDEYDDYEE